MALKIYDEERDVYLPKSEIEEYREEYKTAYRMYSGVPPSFEQFCKMKKQYVKRG